MIAIRPDISKKSASASADKDTDDIEAIAKGGRGNFNYTWNNSGTDATVNNKNSSKTKITGKSTLGKTKAYCTIYDVLTGNTVLTPEVDVDWTAITLTASTISATKTYTGLSQLTTVLDRINGTYSGTAGASGINVGSYTTTITGTGDYTGSVIGTLIIDAATLNLTTAATSFTYNGASQSLSYNVTGAVAGDTGYSVSGTTSSKNAGTYTATLTKSSTNYVLGTTTTINWSIGKAVLTITTSNSSMTYGSTVPTSSFGYSSLSGLLGTDTANVITNGNSISVGSATHSTTATSTSVVGTYPITTNVSGLLADNYSFASVNGTLTISKAVLTITTNVASMTYGSSLPTFSYTPTGFVNSQTASVISGTVTYSTTATSTSPTTTTYAVTPVVSGLTATNYSFTPVNGTLTINKAALTITTNNVSMTYGSSLPTFTYTPTGFVNSETASVVTGTVTYSTTATSTSPTTSTYAITPVVSGLSATNYSFTPANGTLTINKAVLTITVNNASITYGSAFPTLTYTITGFKGTDTASAISATVSYGVSGGPTYDAGSYSIVPTVTNFTATNYTFTTVNGTLTINQTTLTATGINGSATFNGDPQSFTITGINGTYRTDIGSPTVTGTNANTYTTTITGSGNYTGTVTGTLVISPATITLQAPLGYASVPSVAYDGTTKSVGYTVGGTARNNYSYTISSTSGIAAGVYTSTIASTTTNYVVSATYNSFIWYITTPLTASSKTGTATYNGQQQSFTITGINAPTGSYTGSPTVSGTGVEVYTTTIYGSSFYTGSVTGTLTISAASLTASTTTSPYTTYNRSQQSFTISGINGTYRTDIGSPTVYGTNAGSYTTTIYGTGNYTGSVTGTLIIHQDVGYVDIFYGGVYDASRTTSVIVPVRTSNASFSVTHSASGPGAADAQHTSFGYGGPYNWNQSYEPIPPGAVVRNTNTQTLGFVVTITAAINDSNYGYMSSETTVTFNAAPPPSGGGGNPEDGTGGTVFTPE